MRKILILIAAAFLIVIFNHLSVPSVIAGEILYVDMVNGNDAAGDGSYAYPYQHIHKAVLAAPERLPDDTDADTIICKDGVYDEEETTWPYSVSKNIIIQSESGDCSKVIIKPRTLYINEYYQGAWFWGVSDVPVSEKRFWKLYNISIIYDETNIITDLTNISTIYLLCYLSRNTNIPGEVVGCFFDVLNKSKNIWAVYPFGAPSNIYKSTFRNFNVVFDGQGATHEIYDNIFEGNDTVLRRGIFNEGYNCFFNNNKNRDDGTALSSIDITVNPDFVDSHSCELLENSPCIDSGILIPGYVENFSGSAPDIGAYEKGSEVIFSEFVVKKAKVNFTDGGNSDSFMLLAEMTLGINNNGINPVYDDLRIQAGAYELLIPAYSFTEGRRNVFVYSGIIDNAAVSAELKVLNENSFSLKLSVDNINMSGTSNPVNLKLTLGDDTTEASVKFSGNLRFMQN
ncbi:MAG: hypothetical protein ABIB11_00570 [Candidatus Omnitrophota bacterium]